MLGQPRVLFPLTTAPPACSCPEGHPPSRWMTAGTTQQATLNGRPKRALPYQTTHRRRLICRRLLLLRVVMLLLMPVEQGPRLAPRRYRQEAGAGARLMEGNEAGRCERLRAQTASPQCNSSSSSSTHCSQVQPAAAIAHPRAGMWRPAPRAQCTAGLAGRPGRRSSQQWWPPGPQRTRQRRCRGEVGGGGEGRREGRRGL